ncbi:MAG: chemotaxis protein CheA [Bacteroidota bacterium]|nr:chemotaxis protein CheA [Bacteroidota bacterium]
MEDYQNVFIEEATEFVGILEESLLLLEDDRQNIEILNEVFRIMHSLKGSGAMFGFDDLSSFTHHLESLFDQIRQEKISVNRTVIDFTFESIDHIKNLIDLNPEKKFSNKSQELIDRIPGLSVADNKNSDDTKKHIELKKHTINLSGKKKDNTYFIRFIPDKNIFKDGTNPLYLIDELVNMGTCIVQARAGNLPAFEKLNPIDCYFSWDIILATKDDFSSIEDVFIFVSDNSEIVTEKIAEFDLFENVSNKEILKEILNNPDVAVSDFSKLVNSNIEEKIQKLPDLLVEKNEMEQETGAAKENIVSEEKPKVNITNKLRVSTVRVKSENLDNLINIVSELVTMQARLQNIAHQNGDIELISFAENFQKLSRQFRDLSFEMRLVPIQNLFVKFQRLVHDLSKELNKDVNFITEGLETELDKNVIELISEPILHILRNSLDHGIEPGEIRRELNKPEKASLKLKAFYSGADVIIELQDDGKGIDVNVIKQLAVEKALIQPGTTLSNKEILNLIFEPGFSTKQTVSNLSGRGVGMDVVKRKIEELRGSVEVTSVKEKGTSIRIRLPLTLSMIDGFLVRIKENTFIIPLTAINKIHELKTDLLDNSFNNIINIDDEQIPYIYLMNGVDSDSESDLAKYIVLIKYDNKKVGLVVDEVFGEYQVVLKPLGHLVQTNDYFSGAAIMGDGNVALVIDTNKLIQQFTAGSVQSSLGSRQ